MAATTQTSNFIPIPGSRNILVTSALPYVNNVPHLGNIIGCVLSADCYQRFAKQRGYNTLYVCGTDEYGTTTEQKAIAEKTTPEAICEKYHVLHKQIYEWFDIAFDKFGRTSTEQQTAITQEIFWELNNNGFISEDVVEQLYCENCKRFLADRFVEGICPDCGAPDARGDQCDSCQHIINAVHLKNPKCKLCEQSPTIRTSKHLFLDLPKLVEPLNQYIEDATKENRWSQNAISIAKFWAKDLHKRCITRDLKWGTPVPLDGYKDKVFYVWFDAPIGYISITAGCTQHWRKWWKADAVEKKAETKELEEKETKEKEAEKEICDVDLVQFLGKDNIPFHTIIFPGTLLGTKSGWTTMKHISTTEYLIYEDAKFSKSKGTGVFGDDAMKTNIPSEVYRFYLLANRPENADTAFLWDELGDKNNNELLANLGNFVHRTMFFVYANWDKKVPKIGTITERDKELISSINKLLQQFISEMERIQIRDAVKTILGISRAGNQYVQENTPWKELKKSAEERAETLRAETVEVIALNVVKLLAIITKPFMPAFSRKLSTQLNMPELVENEFPRIPEEFSLTIAEGHTLNEPVPIIRNLPKEEIIQLKMRFSGSQTDLTLPPQTADLRVVRILSVDNHPSSEHLYVLKVSFDNSNDPQFVKTIVAGLRDAFPPEALLQKQVLCVANLKPSKLRGVVSEGMILVGDNSEGKLSLCFPTTEVKNGSFALAEKFRKDLPKKPIDLKTFQKLELSSIGGFCCFEKHKLLVDEKIEIVTEVKDCILH